MPELSETPGRRNKLAYACKTYFAWKYLAIHGYDQVLVVDDSSCIRPSAPNPFDLVPLDHWGYTYTSKEHASDSFNVIKEFIAKAGLPEIEYVPSDYMSSAVMLYGSQTAHAIHPDKICASADLLYAKYPHQTLSYYLMKSAGVPSIHLPKAFNSIPGIASCSKEERKHLKDISPYLGEKIYISHITGAYRHRGILVQQIAEAFMNETPRVT